MDSDRLRQLLGPAVRSVTYLPETGSTNLDAKELATKGKELPLVVVADHQTSGRGRLDRSWYSAPGMGVQVSIAARASAHPEALGAVSLAAGLATRTALAAQGVQAGLKWPNDVLAGGKKIAGCLIEIVSTGGPSAAFVAGIGINANHTQLPQEFSEVATSALLETGETCDREKLVADLAKGFLAHIERDPAEVVDLYRQVCDTIGRRVTVELGGSSVEGVATDVDDHGRLVLDGNQAVYAGDVVHLGQKLG
ncbi:MAG TPA: biotin--[acetyl-CoA-carboxylase] ligase [Actinomycetota bacterium]|nr:biotin--[acetyl-CoA-carboxylase] ligase [Actinomycetota bacterium]